MPGPATLAALGALDSSDGGDDLDDLDLPIGDDWDDEQDPPSCCRQRPDVRVVAGPQPASVPRVLEVRRPPVRPDANTDARATALSYEAQVQRVLDPATPLPLAMSLLHRLRAPELRLVAAGKRLAPALVAAARRRTGAV